MPDDLTRRGPEDPTKINVHEKWEIQYWTKKFDVTESQLKAAVTKVGVLVSAVKKELGK